MTTELEVEIKHWPAVLICVGLVLMAVTIQGMGLVMPSEPAMTIRVDGQVIGHTTQAIEYDIAAKEIRIYTTTGVMCRPEPRFWDRFERTTPDIERRPRR